MTLIELVVVLAIIATFMDLLLPALQIVRSGSAESSSPAVRPLQPRLVLPCCSLHLGQGVPGQTLVGRLRLSNLGTAPLIINRVVAGCGCASWKLSKKEIQPREVGELELSARLTREGEQLSFVVQILSNDPDHPAVSHVVAAEAPAFLRTLPDQIHFGDARPGASLERELVLLRPDGTPWPSSQHLECSLMYGDAVQIVKGTDTATHVGVVLTLRLRSDLPPGDFADTLKLRQSESNRTIEVPITGYVVAKVRAIPSVLYFGLSDGASGKRRILLRSTDGGQLGRVIKVDAPPYLTVEYSAESSPETQILTATLVRESPVEPDTGQIAIWHDGEEKPTRVEVTVGGRALTHPGPGSGQPKEGQ